MTKSVKKIEKSESWKAAIEYGCRFFWAHTHVGNSIQFVGQSWEDGGFYTDEDGDPTRDWHGNTVAGFSVDDLDARCESHVEEVTEWYG